MPVRLGARLRHGMDWYTLRRHGRARNRQDDRPRRRQLASGVGEASQMGRSADGAAPAADLSRNRQVVEDGSSRSMAQQLDGIRVAILAADGVERVELEQPRKALDDAGAQTELVSISGLQNDGEVQARNNDLEQAGTFSVDRLVDDISADAYDALLLPGGTVNPDKLRMQSSAVDFVRSFVQSGKPVAAICHGPWTLVEAGVVTGRRLTSFPSLRTDLRNAGAEVVDEQVVTDGNITTSRSPQDLSAFCQRIVEEFAAAGRS
jgi:protease I